MRLVQLVRSMTTRFNPRPNRGLNFGRPFFVTHFAKDVAIYLRSRFRFQKTTQLVLLVQDVITILKLLIDTYSCSNNIVLMRNKVEVSCCFQVMDSILYRS